MVLKQQQSEVASMRRLDSPPGGWRYGPTLVYERTVQDESEDLYVRLSVEAPHAMAGAARRETFTHAIETTDADRINEVLSVGLGI